MEEKMGIKESKEALEGMMELAKCMMMVFKDGVQLADAAELWDKLKNDPEVSAKMMMAYEGYKHIPAEMKDLDLAEGFELAYCAMRHIPEMIEIMKQKDEEKAQ
jgi:hypothetical protein